MKTLTIANHTFEIKKPSKWTVQALLDGKKVASAKSMPKLKAALEEKYSGKSLIEKEIEKAEKAKSQRKKAKSVKKDDAKVSKAVKKAINKPKEVSVKEAYKMFQKVNKDCKKTGEPAVPFSDVEFYAEQIENLELRSSEKECIKLAEELAKLDKKPTQKPKSIKSLAIELITEGKEDKEIITVVKESHPDSKFDQSHVSWYRSTLFRDGIIGPEFAPRKSKAYKEWLENN